MLKLFYTICKFWFTSSIAQR